MKAAFALATLTIAGATTPPTLLVPECSTDAFAAISHLQLSSGAAIFPADTHIEVCWTNDFLSINYQALADPFLKNEHATCNSETWQQEVVELFVGPKHSESTTSFLTSYLEVEISPQNTLYVARISNPYGNGTNKTNQMIDCDASGIEHTSRMGHNSFNANLTVPWRTIYVKEDAVPVTKVGQTLYGNFFRVLMDKPVTSCTPETCKYGAWSPTFDIPPQFHVTTVFGEIKLV